MLGISFSNNFSKQRNKQTDEKSIRLQLLHCFVFFFFLGNKEVRATELLSAGVVTKWPLEVDLCQEKTHKVRSKKYLVGMTFPFRRMISAPSGGNGMQ